MKNLKKEKATKNLIKKLPETPGVYVFWSKDAPIYVGKAKNLKSRVSSYFGGLLEGKTKKMMGKVVHFSHIDVDSDFESLLLEAKLIRSLKPHFNVVLKDDKHPLYIKITKEEFPRIITARKSEAGKKNLAFFGPFPSSRNVKSVLKAIRKAYPYSDHKITNRACLRSQMGLCNPCPSVIGKSEGKEKKESKEEYLKNIRTVKKILSGNIKSTKKELLSQIERNSKKHNFEDAKILRDKLFQLEYITKTRTPSSYYLENPNLKEEIRKKELEELENILFELKGKRIKLERIECYDISHLSGKGTTASMVTFVDGEAEKSLYRKFKVNQKKGNSDTDSFEEISRRRINNIKKWGAPDLVVVDGGKGQVTSFLKIEKELGIPVVGIAKREETLFVPIMDSEKTSFKQKTLKGPVKNLIQRIRDESHRFARRYHHHLLSKELLSLNN